MIRTRFTCLTFIKILIYFDPSRKQEQNPFEDQYHYQQDVRIPTQQVMPKFIPQMNMMNQNYQMEQEVYSQRSVPYQAAQNYPQYPMYNEYPDEAMSAMPMGRMKNPIMSQSMHDPFTYSYEAEEKMQMTQGLPAKLSPRIQNMKMPQPEADFYDNATLNQSMRLMKMAAMMNKSKRTIQRFNYYNQPEQYDEWNMMNQQPMYQEQKYVDYSQMQNVPRFSEPQKMISPRGQSRNEMVQNNNSDIQKGSPNRDINMQMYPQENQYYMQDPLRNPNMRHVNSPVENINLMIPRKQAPQVMTVPEDSKIKSDKNIEYYQEKEPETDNNEDHEEEPTKAQSLQPPQPSPRGNYDL